MEAQGFCEQGQGRRVRWWHHRRHERDDGKKPREKKTIGFFPPATWLWPPQPDARPQFVRPSDVGVTAALDMRFLFSPGGHQERAASVTAGRSSFSVSFETWPDFSHIGSHVAANPPARAEIPQSGRYPTMWRKCARLAA